MKVQTKVGLAGAVLTAALLVMSPEAWGETQSQDQNPPPQQAQQDSGSLADAARKAKADKSKNEEKPAAKKVFTSDDFPSSGGAVSTSSDKDSAAKDGASEGARRALGKAGGATGGNPTGGNSTGGNPTGGFTRANLKDEAYWRHRAQDLRDRMADVDQQIDALKEEMKKGGNSGFNVQSGLANGTAYVEDRNVKMKKLEEQKAYLQKRMEELEDEARKADIPPSWIR